MTTYVSKLQLLLLHKLFVDFCLYIFSCYLQSVQFSRPEKLSFFILNINWKEVWRGTDLHDHHSNYSWYFSILVYSCISYSKFKTKIFFLLILFIYLWLHCLPFCSQGFSSCDEWGYSSFGSFAGSSDARVCLQCGRPKFDSTHRLLVVVASLVGVRGL